MIPPSKASFNYRMARRRTRTNWPLSLGIVAFMLTVAGYISWPLIVQVAGGNVASDAIVVSHGVGDAMRERMIACVATGWIFVLGASIGSFLNVVAYRMPMGLTFVSKPSRCPFCETPIKSKHNVPILGWLVLRGRCNACRLPISPRYIFVEIFVGTMFLSLFLAAVASGGQSLPFRNPDSRSGVMWSLLAPSFDLIGIYCYQAFLLAILSTLTLIKFDRFRVPERLAFFTIAMGVSLRCVWPDLCVVPAPEWMSEGFARVPSHSTNDSVALSSLSSAADLQIRIARVAFDLMVGCVVGAFVQTTIAGVTNVSFRSSPCASLLVCCLVGVHCGWPALLPMLFIGLVVRFVLSVFANVFQLDANRLWTMSFLLGTWITLCYWRQLSEIWSSLDAASFPTV